MKTSSFHQALIDSGFHIGKDGLFCGDLKPKSRFTMLPCGKRSCSFCHAINSSPPRADQLSVTSAVNFLCNSMHEFVNGYTTYLNGPVVRFSFMKNSFFLCPTQAHMNIELFVFIDM